MMRRFIAGMAFVGSLAAQGLAQQTDASGFRRLPVGVFRDRLKAGWLGQIVGVSWGGPTEFRWTCQIIPEDKMPRWGEGPANINAAFGQDDLYVDMTFLRTLEKYGIGPTWRQAGLDFALTRFPLWCANNAGRTNIRKGIMPPDSGHPKFNEWSEAIDYQIEADYAGLIAPGLPNEVVRLGDIFGRLMNYGDGIYGGIWVGAMYAAAFFESDPVKIVKTGLEAIPRESRYHQCISDVLKAYDADPDDWEAAWRLVQRNWHDNPRLWHDKSQEKKHNVGAKLNGAYIAIGVLFGHGDPEKTMVLATRCGQDSDCNPSSAGGIVFTALGLDKIPPKFKEGLDQKTKFSNTEYNFPMLLEVCEKLARQIVAHAGGKVATENGQEVFVIPVQKVMPPPLEQSDKPGPIADSRATPEEMEKMRVSTELLSQQLQPQLDQFAPGWKLHRCGPDMDPGLKDQLRGRRRVFVTHPLEGKVSCYLDRTVTLPADPRTMLKLTVGHHEQGDWRLVITAMCDGKGKVLLRKDIGPNTCKDGWTDIDVDLSDYAGKTITLKLENQPTDWSFEAGYWAKIELVPPPK
jgi:hypothetical protein